jgi:hypothetical protein
MPASQGVRGAVCGSVQPDGDIVTTHAPHTTIRSHSCNFSHYFQRAVAARER